MKKVNESYSEIIVHKHCDWFYIICIRRLSPTHTNILNLLKSV